ncbi:MAG: hypothetical protein RLZZ152_2261, partial [Pseudomonadota bacterium]
NPYGHLKVGNKVILPPNLAGMVGATLLDVEGWLDELHQSGVYELGEGGEIYSKRMVRDECLRNKRAEGGKLGGNPALKVNHEDNPKVEIEDKQKPTPSSSSLSSSPKKKYSATSVVCPSSVNQQVWDDWMIVRKGKNAKTLTQTGWNQFVKQVEKSGWSLEQAISHCCLKQWVGFDAEWIVTKQIFTNKFDVVNTTTPPPANQDAALKRIFEDDKKAVPIPLEVLRRMAELKRKTA